MVVEVPRGRGERPLARFDWVGVLSEGGSVAKWMGQYEDRQSQRDMAAYIADGYNDGGTLVLEAGTWGGKAVPTLGPAPGGPPAALLYL